MFASRADALAQLTHVVPDDIREDILALLTPAIGFAPADADPGHTAHHSRIGGVPDVGPGFEWPRLELTAEEVAALPTDVPSLPGVTLDEGHSLCFIAQVDLEEVGLLGDVAKEMPKHGQLLFFWDQMVGCWADGPGATRVVWHTTPAEDLAAAELPEDLRRKHEAAGYEWSRFYAPARAARLYEGAMLPPMHEPVLEYRELQDELRATVDVDLLDEIAWIDGEFCAAEWCAIQLLGVPQPVQAEPRDSFADEDPDAWRLLFQFPLSDWDPEYGEGRIFFLIPRDDFAAHDFSRVRTVYQQT